MQCQQAASGYKLFCRDESLPSGVLAILNISCLCSNKKLPWEGRLEDVLSAWYFPRQSFSLACFSLTCSCPIQKIQLQAFFRYLISILGIFFTEVCQLCLINLVKDITYANRRRSRSCCILSSVLKYLWKSSCVSDLLLYNYPKLSS